MAVLGYFFNAVYSDGDYDRKYNMDDFCGYLYQLVRNGVFPTPSTQLQVRASSGMNVIVGMGEGWINGHKLVNTTDLTLTLDASDVILNRIDAIVMYMDLTNRVMGIRVKTGTPNNSPVAPAMTRTSSLYEMCLAQIRVNKQVTAVTDANITDTRSDNNICGFVTGLIDQIDTSTLFAQYQAQFDEFLQAAQSQLSDFKKFKKLEATVTTSEEDMQTFNVASLIPTYSYIYDILEVYINGLHLTSLDYSLNNGVVTLTRMIQEPGAVVDFVVYHLEDPDS